MENSSKKPSFEKEKPPKKNIKQNEYGGVKSEKSGTNHSEKSIVKPIVFSRTNLADKEIGTSKEKSRAVPCEGKATPVPIRHHSHKVKDPANKVPVARGADSFPAPSRKLYPIETTQFFVRTTAYGCHPPHVDCPTYIPSAFGRDKKKSSESYSDDLPDGVGERGSAPPFPDIKSKHSLVAKYVTKDKWDKLGGIKTKTTGFTLGQAIACAVEFDNQHCGIYAGDEESYKVFGEVFDPLICDYHGLPETFKHRSDMDVNKLNGTVEADAPVHSTRIRVGRSIQGFGLSPGITKEQRLEVESLMKRAFAKFTGDLAGEYYPLTGMDEKTRQQLVDDHFLFMSGDPNLKVAGMERDWPEGRGIFHNKDKTFLVWVNEEDQLRIISMQKGGDVKAVFERLARGIKAVQDSVKAESGHDFQYSDRFGYIHSCPTNLGTGMRASVHVDLPGWTKEGGDKLKAKCEELQLQPRGTRGESGGQTGHTYDISNKHRLGYSEVELVQKMIDGVNELYKTDLELQKKHGMK